MLVRGCVIMAALRRAEDRDGGGSDVTLLEKRWKVETSNDLRVLRLCTFAHTAGLTLRATRRAPVVPHFDR